MKKHWGCQHPPCLIKCHTASAHNAWLVCDWACDAHVMGWATLSSQVVLWGVVLKHRLPESRKFKGRERGVFLKHKNYFECSNGKGRNRDCWMLGGDIWKLLGQMSVWQAPAIIPERQNKKPGPRLPGALLFWGPSLTQGIHWTIPAASYFFQGCCGEKSPGSFGACLGTLNPRLALREVFQGIHSLY